ncbi:MAG: hypothetical protein J2P37_16970, partial [Ktedonobacteraceae bacterium]|nr:hypothetical protein [Ktedonobacteraceae bacterium]
AHKKEKKKQMKILQVLTRVYISREQRETGVAFYESLFGTPCGVRESYPEAGIEAVQVGSILLIAGETQTLGSLKATQANFLVDSLIEWKDFLLESGATFLDGPKQAPTGWEMRVKHPDGTQVKYVQYHDSVYHR